MYVLALLPSSPATSLRGCMSVLFSCFYFIRLCVLCCFKHVSLSYEISWWHVLCFCKGSEADELAKWVKTRHQLTQHHLASPGKQSAM